MFSTVQYEERGASWKARARYQEFKIATVERPSSLTDREDGTACWIL